MMVGILKNEKCGFLNFSKVFFDLLKTIFQQKIKTSPQIYANYPWNNVNNIVGKIGNVHAVEMGLSSL